MRLTLLLSIETILWRKASKLPSSIISSSTAEEGPRIEALMNCVRADDTSAQVRVKMCLATLHACPGSPVERDTQHQNPEKNQDDSKGLE